MQHVRHKLTRLRRRLYIIYSSWLAIQPVSEVSDSGERMHALCIGLHHKPNHFSISYGSCCHQRHGTPPAAPWPGIVAHQPNRDWRRKPDSLRPFTAWVFSALGRAVKNRLPTAEVLPHEIMERVVNSHFPLLPTIKQLLSNTLEKKQWHPLTFFFFFLRCFRAGRFIFSHGRGHVQSAVLSLQLTRWGCARRPRGLPMHRAGAPQAK